MQNNIPDTPFKKDEKGLKILAFGDVIGLGGVNAIVNTIPVLKKQWDVDFVIVNGENANGFGMLPISGNSMFSSGVDILTGGNHTFRPKKVFDFLNNNHNIIRPYNLVSEDSPGRGFTIFKHEKCRVGIINLVGQVFMDPADNPFRASDKIIEILEKENIKHVIVDFHAEATGEKVALANYLDGRISLIFGTHTHVQTSDERILPNKTGMICDLGMTGSIDSIIGMDHTNIIKKYTTGIPGRFNTKSTGEIRLQGISAVLDKISGKCTQISRVNIKSL
jgi:2',3'-cyclic-nucleotide 2'-phosphodiesterase